MAFNILRFKDIVKKEYKLEVVTPMFLGGAEKNSAEIRVPSLKGMLRFWWRAIKGISDTKKLYESESEIFGNTEQKSKLIIKIKIKKGNITQGNTPFNGKKYIVESKGRMIELDILHYLAYGVYTNKQINKYILPGSTFEVELSIGKDYLDEIEKAFKYLVLFGGLGAKSRNGFGSMFCDEFKNINLDNLVEELKKGDRKQFTSFSENAFFKKFSIYKKWEDALSEIGIIYRDARLKLENRHQFTKRAYIAKPIIAKNERIPEHIKDNRHAKPLFLHVNKIDQNQYQGQILILPYNFNSNKKKGKTENESEYMKVISQLIKKIC